MNKTALKTTSTLLFLFLITYPLALLTQIIINSITDEHLVYWFTDDLTRKKLLAIIIYDWLQSSAAVLAILSTLYILKRVLSPYNKIIYPFSGLSLSGVLIYADTPLILVNIYTISLILISIINPVCYVNNK